MYGYKIKFGGLPKIKWACETQVKDFEWHNTHSPDMLELGITSGKEMTVFFNGNKHSFKDFINFSSTVGCDARHSFAPPETPINTVSVAVSFPELSVLCGTLTEKDAEDNGCILLPAVSDELSKEDIKQIDSLLHKLIKQSTNEGLCNNALFYSLFFELLYTADAVTRAMLISGPKDIHNYYVKKIDHILERDYAQKLTAQHIAASLGISPVYLSSMYKKVTGKNLSEHLLNIRMANAKRLLSDPNIPTARVAALCGFCDECYFRKKFKAYTGLNVREYRLIKQGLTLYHDKPIRQSYSKSEE